MEAECRAERVRRVAACRQFQVVAEQLLVVGVYAVFDDFVSALNRRFAAKVGNALVGDEHAYAMFAVVEVRHHRHDVADFAAFGDARTAEN